MLVYVYNPTTNRVEKYDLGLKSPMPYTEGSFLTVDEFRGSTTGTRLWTDRRTMETFTAFRKFYNKPIYVGYAFRRIWEGGHSGQSQHYAGMAFDTGQNLTTQGRQQLYRSAVDFGRWRYVEPIALTPRWIHYDYRLRPAACTSGGYILVRRGDKGVYVFVLQDALNAIGYTTGGLDGVFGQVTQQAVEAFQAASGLTADGIVGCNTWRALTSKSVGIGRTSTVIY